MVLYLIKNTSQLLIEGGYANNPLGYLLSVKEAYAQETNTIMYV